ncbi:MAG: hypothetical protein KAJ25_05585, partial [Desulfobacula sp.]|nr:hypothetical protein [Desulfobacula sp.]
LTLHFVSLKCQNLSPTAGTIVPFFKPKGATLSANGAKGGIFQRSQVIPGRRLVAAIKSIDR